MQLFNDLHSRGYCVGPGSAYGGTYCIYDGNPDDSHSLATVRLVNDGLVRPAIFCCVNRLFLYDENVFYRFPLKISRRTAEFKTK
jgi:hypothetical protein